MLIILYSPTGGQKKLGKWDLLSYNTGCLSEKKKTFDSKQTIHVSAWWLHTLTSCQYGPPRVYRK